MCWFISDNYVIKKQRNIKKCNKVVKQGNSYKAMKQERLSIPADLLMDIKPNSVRLQTEV